MLKPGDTAPDFTLPDADGAEVSLYAALDRGPVVLSFYPADFTPVCTAQNCMLRDEHDRLTTAGYRTLAVSPQPADSKARFRAKHGLTHTVLADPDRVAIRAFGVGGPFGITRRATFLINPDRTIADRAVADLRVAPHKSLVDKAIKAAKPEL